MTKGDKFMNRRRVGGGSWRAANSQRPQRWAQRAEACSVSDRPDVFLGECVFSEYLKQS